MAPLFAILAGVVMDKMKRAEAEKQAQLAQRMQFAQSIHPDVPQWGYQQQQVEHALDQQGGQSVAALLPLVMNSFGSQEPQQGPSLAQDQGISNAFDVSEDMQRQRAMRGFNSMPGFSNW